MPGIDTITTTMETCASYLSALVPAAFPLDEITNAFSTVGKTFVRKVGELLIILAEAANLSLKLGFSVGAKTIWDTTINWVKDNPTYIIAGYAGKTAIGWRNDAIALKAIKDAADAGAAPVALTPKQLKTYKESLGDIFYRIRNLLCDLTQLLKTGTATTVQIAAIGATKVASSAATFASASTDASGSMDTDDDDDADDDDSIKGLKEDLDTLKLLVDAAVAAQPVIVEEGGGKRSTRKRAGRKSRKSKTRNAKKRKSSGRKAKKVSRKIKSRKGRKTRRRGSKKR
jgi:hypothetical protein